MHQEKELKLSSSALMLNIDFEELIEAAGMLEEEADKIQMCNALTEIQLKVATINTCLRTNEDISSHIEAIQRILNGVAQNSVVNVLKTTIIQHIKKPLEKLSGQIPMKQVPKIKEALIDSDVSSVACSQEELTAQTQALYCQQNWIVNDAKIRETLQTTLRQINAQAPVKHLSCFISCASPTVKNEADESWVQPFLETLHRDLRLAGIIPVLATLDHQPGGNRVAFSNKIEVCEFALLICTDSLRQKHLDPRSNFEQSELSLLRKKYDNEVASGKVRVFSWLISGSSDSATLREHQFCSVHDCRGFSYVENLKQLLQWIYYPQQQAGSDSWS